MSGLIFLAETETRVDETEGTIQIEIRRSGSLSGEVTILYGVQGDTATSGADYAATTGGSVVMADGAASVFVPITILNDALAESTEVFTFSLISATGGTLIAPRTNRISILDDENPAPPPPAEPPLTSEWLVTPFAEISGLDTPVRFAFSPVNQDLVFIAEKAGRVKLGNVETGQVTTILDISAITNSAGDRGLLDVLPHPDLANFPYLYVFHVVDPPETAGQTGNAGPDGAGNRFSNLVRYTLDQATGYTTVVDGSGVVILGGTGNSLADISGNGVFDFTDPGLSGATSSERVANPGDVVINGYKQNYLKGDSLSHNGGKLLFGPDGKLYVLTGDGTSYNYADPRAPEVQSLDTLSGKVLRLDPVTGQGLADNPFASEAADLDANRAKVWQYGLRNPFSAAFDAEGKLMIADVGWSTYEEINTAGPGANFGWPFYEGADNGVEHRTPGYRDLPQAAAFYAAVEAGTIEITLPYRAFAHDNAAPGFQIQSITSGGVVLPGTAYDPALIGFFIFSDFVGGDAYLVSTADRTDIGYLFDWGAFGPVHMVQGPDGYIYYADLFTGDIGRLAIDPVDAPPSQILLALGTAALTNAPAGEYTLTPNITNAVGAVGSPTRIDLRSDAYFSFELNFGDQDFGGADGAAFVLHSNAWGQLGGAGGNLGVIGLPNALAVEFDTWQNDDSEIPTDHTVIYSPGRPGFGTGQNGMVSLGNVEDGLWHRVEISWNAATQTLTTWFDGIQRDTKTADIVTQIFANSPHVNFMITAATGGTTTTHLVRNIRADVLYEDVAGAQAPVLFGGTTRSLSVAENTLAPFHAPFATDAEGAPLTWSIAGGADAARFVIDGATGALRFATGPDFEAPADANGDNIYEVTIRVADPGGLTDSQTLFVTVTDVAIEDLIGTAGADSLLGRPGADDAVYGLGGADTVRSGEGADTIFATINDGDDFYHGGAGGNDLYDISATSAGAVITLALATSAEIGADTLRSIEHINGGQGNDVITGNTGSNRLAGLGGSDTLRGNDGDDLLIGGAGDDSLNGGSGADEMYGGIGNDVYVVNEADDYVFEAANEGADTVISSTNWTLGTDFEALVLTGTAALRGTGNGADNYLAGNVGDNLLRGLNGNDSISGGQGADTLVGGLGADTLVGGAGADIFLYNNPNEGGDRIVSYVGADDTIMVSAAGFGGGLAAGMNLVATGRYVASLTGDTTAATGTGQFTYETDTRILRWDPDGIGGAAPVIIATFQGGSGWSGSEIVVIA